MTKISTDAFQKSFYYIGCGYDIQPLVRFTHITDTFIYTNLAIPQNQIEDWYDDQFRFHPDIEVISKEINQSFDETKDFELHPNYVSHLTNIDFLTDNEKKDYLETFTPMGKDKQWAIVYKLKRISLDREITLTIITAEGLASYIALSHNGVYAPKVLATIQTNILENPEGMLNKLLSKETVTQPEIWIRGVEPLHPVQRIFHQKKSNVLDATGVFNTIGMSFNHKWSTANWDDSSRFSGALIDERHCKAFITESEKSNLEKMNFTEEYSSGDHQLVCSMLDFNTLTDGAIVVVPESMAGAIPPTVTSVVWEKILKQTICHIQNGAEGSDYARLRNTPIYLTVGQQIEALNSKLDNLNVGTNNRIHVIPHFQEDEGKKYVENISKLKYQTTTYLPELLDCIDLKR